MPNEIHVPWNKFTAKEQAGIVAAHATVLDVSDHELLHRVFTICSPDIIVGKANGQCYCRVAAESKDALVLLIDSYVSRGKAGCAICGSPDVNRGESAYCSICEAELEAAGS